MSISMKNLKQGFTLIELLVVIAIIGILTALTIKVAGLASNKSAESKTRSELQEIADALEEYRIQYGVYPNYKGKMDEAGFSGVLVTLQTNMVNHYPDLPSVDRWGRGYVYSNESAYIYSLFSEGRIANDPDDDIDITTKSF